MTDKTETLQTSDFDSSHLQLNLKLTYDQRAIQHQRALDIRMEIEKVRKQLYEQPEQPSETSSR